MKTTTRTLLALHEAMDDDATPGAKRHPLPVALPYYAGVVGLGGSVLAAVHGARVFGGVAALLLPVAAFSAWGGAMREWKEALAWARAGVLLGVAAAGAYWAFAG